MSAAKHVVIVGAGQAGAWAAKTLRTSGYDGAISLFGDESNLPYERPELSKKVLMGSLHPVALCLLDQDYCHANRIQVYTGVKVTALHPESKRIALGNSSYVTYDRAILATGARVRELAAAPRGRPGVHYLRHADDAIALRDALARKTRLVVIGAGFLGLEVAAAAARLGLHVTVVERASRVLDRVAPPEVAEDVESVHRAHGVEFRLSSTLETVRGEAGIEAIQLHDGTWLECELLVVAIGVLPNVDLARDAGAAVSDGIDVDEYGATSLESVYAVGDVANHPNGMLGCRLRLESWQNAQNQAIRVASGVAGGPTQAYREVPWFWSDQFDLNIQMVGLPSLASRTVTRRLPGLPFRAVHVHLREDRIIGATALNAGREIRILRQLIECGARPSPNDLRDSAISFKDILVRGE